METPIHDEKVAFKSARVVSDVELEGSAMFVYDTAQARKKRHCRRITRSVVFLLPSLLVFTKFPTPWSTSYSTNHEISVVVDQFNWTAMLPSATFQWAEYYDKFQCARLSVPLDYTDPNGTKAAVAVVRLPAKQSPRSQSYGGPVLINPGGPGLSGIEVARQLGEHIQTIVGDQFDIVGFDPRGVGRTTPGFYAFDDQIEAGRFYLDFPTHISSSSDGLGKAYAYSGLMGNLMEESSRNVTEYVSTPIVARDMLSISKAMGQDKLHYWGFSYGSVLGATFAAMFPDNVGRVVIDGVVDAENYYSGLWSNNLLNTDAALLDVCDACVEAGPQKCTLYESSADLVLQRINKLLENLKIAPVTVFRDSISHSDSEYGIVGYETVKNLIFATLFNTHALGAGMINMLAELEKGNALPIFPLTVGQTYRDLLKCDCPSLNHQSAPVYGPLEHTLAIACGDNYIEEESLAEVKAVYDKMAMTSAFADVWMFHVRCSGWKVKGKERFQGSFKHKTSHPLLLVGTTADPVTPLQLAHKMSKGFEGSVVLSIKSSGHCSISGTSLCANNAIRAYFQNGTLPDEGTVCETESSIFVDSGLLERLRGSARTADDANVLEAAHMLNQNYFVSMNGLTPPFQKK